MVQRMPEGTPISAYGLLADHDQRAAADVSAYKVGGQWRFRFRGRLPNGREADISGTPARNTERAAMMAEREAIDAEIKRQESERIEAATPTMAEWSTTFLAHVQATMKPTTAKTRAGVMKRHVLPVLGPLRLHEINRRALDELADRARASGLGPSSVRSVIDTACAALRLAEKRDMIAAVPRANRPPVPPNHERYLSADQERAALAVADARERAALLLGLRAGMRRSEIAGGQWADLSREGNGGRLRLARQWVKGAAATPKNGRPRTVELSPDVWAALESWRAVAPASIWIFPSADDLAVPFSEQEQSNMIARIGTAAGIDDLHWHLLRHTCASRLVAAGVHMRAVQKVLGHGAISVTERYAHLAPDATSAAVAQLDEIMRGGGPDKGEI